MSDKEIKTAEDSGVVIEDIDDKEALSSNTGNAKLSGKKLITFGVVAAIVLVGGGLTAYGMIKNQFSSGDDKKTNTVVRNFTTPPQQIGKLDMPAPKPAPKAEVTPDAPLAEDVPVRPGVPQPLPVAPEDDKDSITSRRLAAELKTDTQASNAGANADSQETPAAVEVSSNVKLMKNIDYTLLKGTQIPCVLETNIVSEQDGYTSCVISQDVYSGNARVLLLEKGTRVTGQYHGDVDNGDRRLGIMWDRLVTPYDIAVKLNSPTTGRLGASGITGKVDNRWWTRIGSALLISLISDSLSIAGDNSDNADVVVDSDTAQETKTIAGKILDKNIDLPPIIYIKEGQQINIYVANDIDLSSVYNARAALVVGNY